MVNSDTPEVSTALPSPGVRSERLRLVIGAFSLVSVLAVLFGAAFITWREHRTVLAQTAYRAENLAGALGEHVSGTFQALDATLRHICREIIALPIAAGSAPVIERLGEYSVADLHPGVTVVLFAGRGELVAQAGPGLRLPAANADKPYFTMLSGLDDDVLTFGPPVRADESSPWTLPVGRPLFDADGRFAGALIAFLDADSLVGFARSVALAPEESVSAFAKDGTLLARMPRADDAIGKVFAETSAGADGVARSIARHEVPDFPFFVSVGLSTERALASWRANLPLVSVAVVAVIAVVAVLTGLLFRNLAEAENARRELEASERRFRKFFDAAFEGMVIADKGIIVDANSALADILGRPAKEILGQPLARFVPDADIPALTAALDSADERPHEIRASRRDGREVSIELRGRNMEIHGQTVRAIAIQDVTDRHRAAETLRMLATRDPLTECLNRRAFFEVAEKEFEQFRRYDRPLSVLMVDADRFKAINDRHGHLVGDRVLRDLAHRCRAATRASDVVGRYGGEEFAILLPETEHRHAVDLAARLLKSVGEADIATGSGPLAYSISIGIATTEKGMGDLLVLLKRADDALYEAKRRGRNRLVPWSAMAPSAQAAQ